MPTLKEIEIYLKGLWLLVKQEPGGFAYLDVSDRGALRSFWAIVWALPAILLSFAWWRILFLEAQTTQAAIGPLFFFRLALVEAANWLAPIILLGLLCWMVGLGEKFSALVVVTNWLALPASYAYGVLVLIMMLVPALTGLVAILWFMLMVTLIAGLFRIIRMIVGDHLLTVSTIIMVILVPSMILAEVLERYLGVYPG